MIEQDDQMSACLIGSRNIKQICEDLQSVFTDFEGSKMENGVVLPENGASEIDFSALGEKFEAFLTLTTVHELLFTKTLKNGLKLVLMLLGDCKSACLIVERSASLTRIFLKSMNFREIQKGSRFVVLALSKEEDEEKMEES